MRNFTIYLVVILCSFASKIYAQETFETKVKAIANTIERITQEEKQALKSEVEEVNIALEKGSINNQQADEKKMQLAQATADKIEERVAIEEDKLNELVKEKVDGKITENNDSKENDKEFLFRFKHHAKKDTIPQSEKRTTSQLVLATGFNNLVTNGMVANSNFGYLRSMFYEWGFTHNTRIIKENNLLHAKYGVSFVYNSLSATDNRYFVVNDEQTNLETSPVNLRKRDSYFKNVFVTIPVHLEFDFSKNKSVGDKTFFQSHKGLRIGLGGFVGYNLNSKQFLSYKENGYTTKQKVKGNWNIEDWNYGLSTYIGYKETSLYLKYDLNPMFKNNAVDQNNISLGLRFDFN